MVVGRLELHEARGGGGWQGLRRPRRLGVGYRPRKCSRTSALERQGPAEMAESAAADRCQPTDGRRASDEGRDSLQGSPRACGQAGPRTQTLMGSHGVPSPTEGQDLAEQREGGCSVPAQTETNSKPPSDKAKGLTSWQTEACSAWCPDIFSQRANPHGWPPPASGLRAQPLMIAREVPLRLAKTAVRSQLKGGCLQSALFPTYGACGHVSPHCRPPIFSLLPPLPTRPISVGNRGTASEL